MYGGYQGAYGGYTQQQYAAAANAANAVNTAAGYPPTQHPTPQNYYTGVNPYASYTYAGVNVALPPPPPPPTAPTHEFSTFPTQSINKLPPTVFAGGAYNGYDAAIYQYAHQSSHSAKSTPSYPTGSAGGGGATWNKSGGGASGGNGGGGRYGRPSSGDSKQYYCEVCKISCAGGITYKEHLEGKQHKKREECIRTGKPTVSLAKNKLSYRCELCNVTCTGQDTYQAHVRGGKHHKTANLHKKLGKYVPEDIPTIIAPGEDGPVETKAQPKWHQQQVAGTKKVIGINTVQFVGGHKLNSTGQIEEKKREVALAVGSVGKSAPAVHIEVDDERVKAMMAAEEVDPIGEEYVIPENDSSGKLIQFYCQICDCKFSDPHAKDTHVKGRRHRLSYKLKIDPSFVVDPKPVAPKKKLPIEQPVVYSTPVNWFTGAPPGANITDERTVDEKFRTMYLGKEYIENTERLMKETRDYFRMVSEKLGDVSRPDVTVTPTEVTGQQPESGPTRIIIGGQHVGHFAKKTNIRGDSMAEMVLLISEPIPTPELVQKIIDSFREVVPSEYTIDLDSPSGVCVIVSAAYIPEVKCRVMITPSSLKHENEERCPSPEFPDKATCQIGLHFLRSAKWFDAYGQYLNSNQSVIRLFRDLRSRNPVWAALDEHQIETMVYNIIMSTSITLNATEAFKRVLQAISSGYLYSALLNDLCDKEVPNLLDTLMIHQKHDITESAQMMNRLIAFDRIHEVLGIDRLTDIPPEATTAPPTLKRPFDYSMMAGESSMIPDGVCGDVAEENEEDDDVEYDEEEEEGVEGEGGSAEAESEEPEIKRGRLEESVVQKEAEPKSEEFKEAEPMEQSVQKTAVSEVEERKEAEPELKTLKGAEPVEESTEQISQKEAVSNEEPMEEAVE